MRSDQNARKSPDWNYELPIGDIVALAILLIRPL